MGRQSRLKAERRAVKIHHLNYDLRAACDDCPFRSDAPFHAGVFGDMRALFESAKAGLLGHSCHKTDVRADCDDARRAPSGAPIQHCVGLLLMAKQNPSLMQWHMIGAKVSGKLDFSRLVDAPVFRSFEALLAHYLRGAGDQPGCSVSQRREIEATAAALEERCS